MKNLITAADISDQCNDSLPGAVADSQIGYWFYGGGVVVAIASAAVLITTCARAQTVPTVLTESTTSAPGSAPMTAQTTSVDAAKPAPKYSRRDIERAFNFLDANHDGKISREEAAGFRNVAKHFDAADTNRDNVLSLQEFGAALNRH